MLTPAVYRIYLSPGLRAGLALGLVVSLVVPLVLFFSVLPSVPGPPGQPSPPAPLALLPLLVFLIILGQAAWTPHAIEVQSGDEIVFRSWLRTATIRAADLRSVRTDGKIGWIVFRHARGRVRIFASFDRFHVLIGEIARAYPSVDIRGC